MKKILLLLAWLGFSLGAGAADQFDGLMPLARDDIAAVAQLKTMPDRHVLLYFGDHAN